MFLLFYYTECNKIINGVVAVVAVVAAKSPFLGQFRDFCCHHLKL